MTDPCLSLLGRGAVEVGAGVPLPVAPRCEPDEALQVRRRQRQLGASAAEGLRQQVASPNSPLLTIVPSAVGPVWA